MRICPVCRRWRNAFGVASVPFVIFTIKGAVAGSGLAISLGVVGTVVTGFLTFVSHTSARRPLTGRACDCSFLK